ncbi:MAG: flagellar hook-basal body complex protein [Rhodobacteraceae bacterium]|nr:flagellar hook-basal body complex protein [Paracoccaceae bacterium]
MEQSTYAALSRQTGLLNEMRVVANNIANSATDGFRQEGLIFSEFVQSGPDQSSVSMAGARVRNTSFVQGAMTQTASALDMAIDGEGFFMVETPQGPRLTRAGAMSVNAEGDLVTSAGFPVMGAGREPIFIPEGASAVRVASDGSLSVDGNPLGQIGVFTADPNDMHREDGVMFRVEGEIEDQPDTQILQFFVEGSNVNAVSELARMIEIQRAYEMGQNLLKAEDDRIRAALNSLTK